jgi:hypothetical protein
MLVENTKERLMTSEKSIEQRMLAAAKKAKREQEAIVALKEYQTEKARVDANTVRLRALRLEKEAADAKAAAEKPPEPKKTSKAAKASRSRAPA